MSKKLKAPRVYDLASDDMRDVDQALANRMWRNEHLLCVYLRAHYALLSALAVTPPTGKYLDPGQLLAMALELTRVPNDEYKALAAKLLRA